MKFCTECKQEKDEIEFYIRTDRKSVTSACKKCRCERERKRNFIKQKSRRRISGEDRFSGKVRSLLKIKRKIQRRKYWIDRYKLSKGCSICGYNRYSCSLDFDHLNPSLKSFQPTSNLGYSLKSIFSELRKCQLLCSNCHRAKTFNAKTTSSL